MCSCLEIDICNAQTPLEYLKLQVLCNVWTVAKKHLKQKMTTLWGQNVSTKMALFKIIVLVGTFFGLHEENWP